MQQSSSKPKRVSWASGGNLCKVKLFLSDDSPSTVGLGSQDDLQAKASWLLHTTGTGSDDHLPPGFEAPKSLKEVKIDIAKIPLIKWIFPPRVLLDPDWTVVSGEESEDFKVQTQRNMRVLEAIYPRMSSIPPSPSVSAEVEHSYYNDKQTPLVPITPIEEEEVVNQSWESTVADTISPMPAQNLSNLVSLPSKPLSNEKPAQRINSRVIPDVAAAATAAFTAIMMSHEQRNLIDSELLIKILSNPELIVNYLPNNGPPPVNIYPPAPAQFNLTLSSANMSVPSSSNLTSSSVNMSVPSSNGVSAVPVISRAPPVKMSIPLSAPPTPPVNMSIPFSAPPANMSVPFSALPANKPVSLFAPISLPSTNAVGHIFRPLPSPPLPKNLQMPPIPMPASNAPRPPMKDLNYYKNLIQQHGEERLDIQDQVQLPQYGNSYKKQYPGSNIDMLQNSNPRNMKTKNRKTCTFFNTSKGCKNGTNCPFTHDSSVQQRNPNIPESQSAKRMKYDREITGRS